MLKIVNGDLFANVKAGDIIAHGCNAAGVMGSGFAETLKSKYPLAFREYSEYRATHGLYLGDVIWKNEGGSQRETIANCVTQQAYGRDKRIRYVSYKAVEESLKKVSQFALSTEKSIHLPLIGGGLANGDRAYLLKMFEFIFYRNDATLWLKE